MGWRAQVPEMPYKCDHPGCDCQREPRLNEVDQTVSFTQREHEYQALVREDGLLVDVLRDHDAVALVRQVHENYPFARS